MVADKGYVRCVARGEPALAGSAGVGQDTLDLAAPRQQFVDAVAWMLGDAVEHIGEPCLRVDAAGLGCLDQRMGDRNGLASGERTREQIILPSEGDGAQNPLGLTRISKILSRCT